MIPSMDDFGGDIKPLATQIGKILGVVDTNGDLDINNLSWDTVKELFTDGERIELFIDLVASMTGRLPRIIPRSAEQASPWYDTGTHTPQTGTGILLKEGSLASGTTDEEWFRLHEMGPVTLYLTLIHDGDANLQIGLGLSFSHTESNKFSFEADLSIPIIRLLQGNPDKCLFGDGPMERVSLRLSLNPDGSTTFPATPGVGPSATGLSFNFAIGGGGGVDTAGALTIHDFKGVDSATPTDLVINSLASMGDDLLDTAVESLLSAISNSGGTKIVDHLLPLLGLRKSSGVPNWPTLNLMSMFQGISVTQDIGQLLDPLRIWLQDIINLGNDGIPKWLEHLGELFKPSGGPAIQTGGSGTVVDPWWLDIASLFPNSDPAVQICILAAHTVSSDGTHWGQIGISVKFTEPIGTSELRVNGEATVWILKLGISGLSALDPGIADAIWLPSLEGFVRLWREGGTGKLVSTSWDLNNDGSSSPLAFSSARAGLSLNSNRDLDPMLELLGVEVGAEYWPVMDLTDSSTPASLFNASLSVVRDELASLLEVDDLLRSFGALVGVCAPRGGAFQTEWYGSGSWADQRPTALDLITAPLDSLIEYHRTLALTNLDIGSGETANGWLYLFDSLGFILQSALSSPSPLITTVSAPTCTLNGDQWTIPLIAGDVALDLSCNIDADTPSATISLGVLAHIGGMDIAQIGGDPLRLSMNAALGLVSFELDDTPSSTVNALTSVEIYGRVFDPLDGRIELPRIGSFGVSISDVKGGFEWSPSTGIGAFLAVGAPQLEWRVPDFSGLTYEQMLLVDWDGWTLVGQDGLDVAFTDTPVLPHIASVDPFTYTYNPGHPTLEFDLEFTTELITLGNCRISTSGFTPPSGLDQFTPSRFGPFIGELLLNQGGAFGFFVSVFFRIVPYAPQINLATHVVRHGLTIPDWYSASSVGDVPSEWRTLHPSNPAQFGLGPLSIPMDWPALDLDVMVGDPLGALRDFVNEISANLSASGEPFLFSAMRWVLALFEGHIPSLRKSNLNWGSTTDGSDIMLTVPDIDVIFTGMGTPSDPYRLRIFGTERAAFTFYVAIHPEGPPRTENFAVNMLTGLPSSLQNAIRAGDPDSWFRMGVDPNWADAMARLIFNVGQFRTQVREALRGWSIERLAEKLALYDVHMMFSDGITSLPSQSDLGNTLGVTNRFGPVQASASEVLLNASVIEEIFGKLGVIPGADSSASLDRLIFLAPSFLPVEMWSGLVSRYIELCYGAGIEVSFSEVDLRDDPFTLPADIDSADLTLVLLPDVVDQATLATQFATIAAGIGTGPFSCVGHHIGGLHMGTLITAIEATQTVNHGIAVCTPTDVPSGLPAITVGGVSVDMAHIDQSASDLKDIAVLLNMVMR